MPKIPTIFSKLGIVILFLTPVLSLLYFIWLRATVHDIFFIGYKQLTCIGGIVFLICYVLGICVLLAGIVTKKKTIIVGSVLYIPAFICLCVNGFMTMFLPFEYHDAKLGKNTYYLLAYDEVPDAWIVHYLVECKGNSKVCYRVSPFFNLSGSAIWPVELIPDERIGELQVFIRGQLVYTYSENPHEYFWADSEFLDDYSYKLSWYENEIDKTFVLSRCNQKTMVSCEILPFSHTTSPDVSGNLMLDQDTGELYILFDGVPYTVFGQEPQKYQYLDFVETELIQPFTTSSLVPTRYSLVAYPSNRGYDYLLYSCTLGKYFSPCQTISFSYFSPNTKNVSLQLDEVGREVKVYDDSVLIFSFGDNPRCYVDNCSTRSKK